MLGKGQVKGLSGRDAIGRAKFIAELFGVAAQRGARKRALVPK
jgi:hypothetical protein